MKYAIVFVMLALCVFICHCGTFLGMPTEEAEDAGDAGAVMIESEAAVDAPVAAQDSASESGSLTCPDAGVTHDNGIGQKYATCDPLSTFDSTNAGYACKAYLDGPPQHPGACTRNPPGCPCPDQANCAAWTMFGFVRAGYDSVVWDFGGPAKGHVVVSPEGRCPTTADPVWN